MDPLLSLTIERNPPDFRPGERLEGRVSWRGAEKVKLATVRLYWTTSGKGTTDTSVIAGVPLDNPKPDDSRTFSFVLPAGPPAFSGKLISLRWGVELVLQPGEKATHRDFSFGPQAREVHLPHVEPNPAHKKPWWRPV